MKTRQVVVTMATKPKTLKAAIERIGGTAGALRPAAADAVSVQATFPEHYTDAGIQALLFIVVQGREDAHVAAAGARS